MKDHMGNLITTKPVMYLVNMSASDYQRCVWVRKGESFVLLGPDGSP